MNRLFLLAATAICSLSAFGQTEVTNYQAGITENGITYFLPSTQIRAVVTATRTHHIPGEFCEYAERYLRLKDVTQTPYDTWKIEDIQLVPFGVADKSKAYSIKLKSKTSAPLVELTSDGRLVAINTQTEEEEDALPVPKVIKDQSKKLNGNDFKTEEILSAGSTSKMAELSANEIYDIRENRSLLTKGQADFMPKDGEQLRLMLANLDMQEEGLLQLFKGTSTQETHILAFDINATENIKQHLLFNFSKYLGVVDADDPAGFPVYLSIEDQQSLPAVAEKSEKSKKEPEDVRYIIPGRALVRIFSDNKEYVSESIPLAQFGRIEHLGGELFNKKSTTHVLLSPVTGGIVKLEAAQPE